MALEAELAKQKTWYQNSIEEAYFLRYLIQPNGEFPQCAPAHMCCSVFLCVIELAITHSGIVCSVSHWGNEGQGPQRVSWHASLSFPNTNTTAPAPHWDVHTLHVHNHTASHTTHTQLCCLTLVKTHTHTIPTYWLLCRGRVWGHMSSTFLGLCKCIPQVRQVVYQGGCAVLKLRVSDTGMQPGEGGRQ